MTLGKRIYDLRVARNLSQGELAEALDVSRQSVSKWETDTSVPDLERGVRILPDAKALWLCTVRGDGEPQTGDVGGGGSQPYWYCGRAPASGNGLGFDGQKERQADIG